MGKSKEEIIRTNGVITVALPNAMFKVELESGHTILCHISGKMRMNYIRLIPGDHVVVDISPYDVTKGRIVLRGRKEIPLEAGTTKDN